MAKYKRVQNRIVRLPRYSKAHAIVNAVAEANDICYQEAFNWLISGLESMHPVQIKQIMSDGRKLEEYWSSQYE